MPISLCVNFAIISMRLYVLQVSANERCATGKPSPFMII